MYGQNTLKNEIPKKGCQGTNALPFQMQSRDHKYSEITDGKHAMWNAAASKRAKLIGTWGRDRFSSTRETDTCSIYLYGRKSQQPDREKQNEQTRQT